MNLGVLSGGVGHRGMDLTHTVINKENTLQNAFSNLGGFSKLAGTIVLDNLVAASAVSVQSQYLLC